MVSAIERVERLDRDACRQHVSQNFSASRMGADYEALFNTLVRRA
jgi:hypothetical protein